MGLFSAGVVVLCLKGLCLGTASCLGAFESPGPCFGGQQVQPAGQFQTQLAEDSRLLLYSGFQGEFGAFGWAQLGWAGLTSMAWAELVLLLPVGRVAGGAQVTWPSVLG